MFLYRIKFVMRPNTPVLVWDETRNTTVIVEDLETSSRTVNGTTVVDGNVVDTSFDIDEVSTRGEKEIPIEDLAITHLMKHDGKFHRVAHVEMLSFPPGLTKEQITNPAIDDLNCPYEDCLGKLILCPVHKDSFPNVSVLYCPNCDMSFSICDGCSDVVADIDIREYRGKYYCATCANKVQ